MMPPPSFSTPPHIPNVNTNERPHVTPTVFAATIHGNTPFAYRASFSTDLTLMISPTFVEANYEFLESLLRDRRREVTPLLRMRSPKVRRQRERVVGFKEVSNTEESITGRNTEGKRPSKAGVEENGRWEMNHPLLLAAHLGRNENGQPLRPSLTFLLSQEKEASDPVNALRKEFEQGCMDQRGVTQDGSTNSFNTISNPVNAASTSGTFSAGGPSSPYPDAFIPANTLLHVNQDDSQIHHPKDQILGDPKSAVQTRSMAKKSSGAHAFMEPKKVSQALDDERWVEAMQEELLQFSLQKVKQSEKGIFISQDKYVAEILKKFDFSSLKTASTRIETQKPLVKDECKKQTIVATFTTEAEYVVAAHCVSHELQTEPHIEKILQSPSTYQRKHKKTHKPRKAKKVTELPQTSVPLDIGADEAVYQEGGDSVERAIATDASLAPRNHIGGADAQTRFETASKRSSDPALSTGHTVRSGEDMMEQETNMTDFVSPTPHDSPLSGGHTPGSDEGRPNLLELMNICTTMSNRVLALEEAKTTQDKVITILKLRVRRLEKKRKARTSQPMKKRLFKGRVETSTDKSLGKDASKQGRNDDQTEELNLTNGADTKVIVEDKGSGEKGGSTAKTVSTSRPEVSSAELKTPPTATTLFDDKDVTIADTFVKMKSQKAKEKGVAFKDADDSARPIRSITTLQSLSTTNLAQRIYEEELAELDRAQKERQKQKEATIVALTKEFGKIQARMDIDHELAPVSPTTAEQRLARKNELKAHGTLLMALPDKHQLKFNIHKDAKTLIEAIEIRFGGNKETKKVQKTLLKQQYENFTENLSLSQEDINLKFLRILYNKWRTHTLVWRNKTDLEEQSLDDLFNSLKIYKAEVKSSSSASTSIQNIAFMSSSNTDSTHEPISAAASVSTVSAKILVFALPNVDTLSNVVIYSFFASPSSSPQLDNDDLKQIDADGLEEMDLKWQLAMLTVRARRFLQRTGRNLGENRPTSMGFDMSKVKCYNCHKKGHFARECRSPKDTKRNGAAEPQRRNVPVETSTSNALVTQFLIQNLKKAEQEGDDLKLKLEEFQTSSKNLRDLLASQTNVKTGLGYNSQVFTRTMFDCDDYCTFKSDESLPPSPIYDRPSAPIIEDWVSDSEDESETKIPQNVPSFVQPTEQIKSPRPSIQHVEISIPTANPKTTIPKPTSNGNRRNRKACFVCKSLDYLIKECGYHEKKLAQTTARNHGPMGHHKYYSSMPLINPQRHVIPTAVVPKSKLVPINAARPITAAFPKINVTKPRQEKRIVTKLNSPSRRHINHSPSPKASNFPQKVTAVKASMGNPQHVLKDKGVIDSGCSRHMIGNMSYLSNFKELNGGYVAFGGNPKGGKISGKGKIKTGKLHFHDVYFVKELKFNLFSVSQMCDKKNSVLFTDTECLVLFPEFKLPNKNQGLLRVHRDNNMYNVDLKNIVPFGDLTCLFAKATLDESNLWHRRFGHINFKTMNKLVKGNLVRGLPSKVFKTDHTCVACKKGEQHRASCKTKPVSSVNQPLQRLHMDLFRPTFVKIMNKKNYCLVVTDDYSRDVAFDKKEPEFERRKPEFEVNVSLSRSAQSKKHDDKTKREAKGKSPVESLTGYRNLSAKFKDFSDNSINEDNAAGTLVPAVGQLSPNSTNTFGAAGPSNAAANPTHEKSSNVLVDLPHGKRAICTKWVFGNKKDEIGIVVRNKARLVVQGHTQEEGIDYEEVFAPVARIEAIRLFLAYASFMGFMVFQMDVKSVFLYETIKEEVYVCQPLGFKDSDYPDKVYKVVKALYGLHQAPRAWYETLVNYLLENGFQKGKIDQTLFIRRQKGDKFQMSSMGELTFFLGLQVNQKKDGIFISQDKYVAKILRKFGLTDGKSASTPIDTKKPLLKDPDGEDVDVHTYRSMIGSLMYVTSSRPAIMFAVYACARFQVTPKASHLHAIKRIFRYLKGKPHLGMWYPKDSPFNLVAYLDSDYAGASLDRKSVTKGCQFFRCRLISWQCKKQTVVATSSTEDEYVAAASCCARVLWIQNQLLDYGPDQMVSGKDSSNPLMADNLPKIIWYSTHHVALIKSWLVQKQTALGQTETGKEISNPFMAGSLPKTMLLTFIHKVNDVTRLQALVNKKKVIITEATIRDALRLDDVEGVSEECGQFNQVLHVSTFPTTYDKSPSRRSLLTYHKVLIPCLDTESICKHKKGRKGCSRVETPLFKGMVVAQQVGEGAAKVNVDDVPVVGVAAEGAASVADDEVPAAVDEPSIPSSPPPTQPPPPSQDIPSTSQLQLTLPHSPITQPPSPQHVKDVEIEENSDVQGRKAESQAQIYQIDLEHDDKVLSMQDVDIDPAELQEVVEVVTTAKLITKRKRVVIRDPEESATPSIIIHIEAKSKDNGKGIMVEEPKPLKKQAQIKLDEAYARELTKEQIEEEDSRALKRLSESQEDKASKKKKLDEEVEELKRHLQIVQNDDDDDVYTEATPLALKVPVIDYEIYIENNKPYYKIKRVDGSHQLYLSFHSMLRNFDREDLEVLWRLVKERFTSTKPKNFFDDFLLTTLGAMFEKPDIQAQIWKNQRSVHGQAKVKRKLLESCGVHIITFTTIQLILLVERKYPPTSFGVDAAEEFKENMLSDYCWQVKLMLLINAAKSIVLDEKETVDPEILSTKYPIVDWESQILGNVDMEDKHVYKRIRANGNTSYHKSFSSMLRKFDRQDLVDLHRLVMKIFEDNTLKDYNLLLLGDLKVMFEPNAEDEIWKKRYRLIKEILEKMLNWKLEAEAESTMAFELLKLSSHRLKNEKMFGYILLTIGQTKVTNRAIKRILERSVRYNPKDWSEKLNDALWDFRTAYKTPIGCTPFWMVYEKACHLPIEIENKAYWALKQCNMDLTAAAKNHYMELNELIELRDGGYENTQIYKERTKKWHDFRLYGDKDFKNREKVLLFNSRLRLHPGKLKSKWIGPFILKTMYRYRAVKIIENKGSSFKVNGHRNNKTYLRV
nr:putative ribonuclease H-like domain-containing protein [Tanacetum cinerariifolium]